jgi:hypothetical protein
MVKIWRFFVLNPISRVSLELQVFCSTDINIISSNGKSILNEGQMIRSSIVDNFS